MVSSDPTNRGLIHRGSELHLRICHWPMNCYMHEARFEPRHLLKRPSELTIRPSQLGYYFVLLIGGSTGTMLENLDVVGNNHGDSPLASVGTITNNYEENNGYIAPSYDEESSSGSRFKMKLKEFHKSAGSFTAIDKNFLTPFFTSQNGDEDEDEQLTSTRSGFNRHNPYSS
ncbi:hypothetical protein PIB30_043115 [Stylosanthes scabra]|uniref:Uncharacterized protein n=1 Tax=Stylosanthes scabra TaxID=79078 RepID=A0ABU6VE68_9FABA|nr:hypothetical protein [Stylosanthes scabra]